MPDFKESKGFRLKSGNTPLFKHMGSAPAPGKKALVGDQANLPEQLQDKIEAAPGKMYGESPNKHTRRRAGHMEKYGAGHTNDDHDGSGGTKNYWKDKNAEGKTQKEIEVAADNATKTDTKTAKTTTTNNAKTDNTKTTKKKKGNFLTRTLQRFDDAVQSKMKNPRSDWDKKGYESERKQRYADYDEKNKKNSGAKLTGDSPMMKKEDDINKLVEKRKKLKEKKETREKKGKGTKIIDKRIKRNQKKINENPTAQKWKKEGEKKAKKKAPVAIPRFPIGKTRTMIKKAK